jgi:hypothetical protein
MVVQMGMMAMDGLGGGMNKKDMERHLSGWRFGTVGTGKAGDFAIVPERISGSVLHDVMILFYWWKLKLNVLCFYRMQCLIPQNVFAHGDQPYYTQRLK